MLEDIHLKYLAFNQTFKTIRIKRSKIILFYLKTLQEKETLKNYWLINLKFLKTNIIQMKIHLICKTDSRN